LSKQKEIQNCLAQTLEPTPFSIEMDVNIIILFATSSPHMSMPQYVPLDQNAIPTVPK
jgi:hypothetical protein